MRDLKPQTHSKNSVLRRTSPGEDHKPTEMEMAELRMYVVYVIWTFLSFLIGAFIINRIADKIYIQYVEGMRQTPEYRRLENSEETSVWTD